MASSQAGPPKALSNKCQHAGLLKPEQDGNPAGQPSGAGGDYFVPWHVPFHRADAVSAIRSASGNTGSSNSSTNRESYSDQGAGGTIDRGTSSVVFKRYYHLFEEGELDGLVARVPNVTLTASFYDKSNWCCIFRRTRDSIDCSSGFVSKPYPSGLCVG